MSLPASRIGKWSFGLFLVSLILILLNNLVAMPWTERHESLSRFQDVFNLVVFLCLFFSCLGNLAVIVMKKERSLVLYISVLLLVLSLAMNIGPLIFK